jgi:hypothetical protein
MRRFSRLSAALFVAVLLAAITVHATTLSVALDIQGQGLSVANGGVGLEGIGSGSRTLSTTIGGPVQAALLYWAGRDRPCPTSGGSCVIPFQPYKDQVLRFDGTLVTGTIIGTETQPVSASGPWNNIGYLADVTSIVQAKGPGAVSFSVEDGDVTNNLHQLNGAGLIVVYTDPLDPIVYRVMLFQGLDFAYGLDVTPGAPRVTVPITFNHGAALDPRVAELTLFVGDAVASRPDRVDISNNPSIINALNASDGPQWDTDRTLVNVPAGVASTTVQLFSEPLSGFPDSLLWQVGVLRVPLVQTPAMDEGCTPGYWKNHVGSWAVAGYSPAQTVGSVFSGASAFPSLASTTLLQALQSGGGSGTLGAARILLRAATAALLNAAHPELDYPRTAADVITAVNTALASNNRSTMLTLATALDNANQLGCNLN